MSFIINLCKYSFISLSILVLVGLFISIQLQKSFPENIKDVQPQIFLSHPARDLEPEVKTLKETQYLHVNDKLIGKCQDFELTKDKDIYCVNEQSHIIKINSKNGQAQKLYDVGQGVSYGNRLSRDQTKLYFINSQLGLCEYDITKRQFRSLVSQFEGEKLLSLNSIETHPQDGNILYITQSTTKLPMYLHTIQILLNNPFGRVYEFNISSGQLKIITDGLYFPNGIVYQVNNKNNEPSLLIAQTNRHRVMRVYLEGQKRGQKQVAIDQLDLFIDNMKLSQTGNLWIAGPTIRDGLSPIADRTPILRKIISRLPPSIFPYLVNKKYFGGIKVTFNENNNNLYDLKYYLYKQLPQFTTVTTLVENENILLMSSLFMDGLLVVDLQKNENVDINQEKNTQEL